MNPIFEHRSIRSFLQKPIPESVLHRIIEGASRASNTGNMQLYSIIITKDKQRKTELCARGHFNQKMVEEAPVILTFCADLHRFSYWCSLRNAEPGYDNFSSFYTATIDAIIAAQNACIVAESEGLGICYLGTTNYCTDAIIDILKLPKLVFPVTTVVMGYPAETPEITDRLPLRAISHKETYQDFSEKEILDVYSEKETSELYKQFVKENNVHNLAEVFTKKRYTTAANKSISKSLLKTMQSQNFMNND